MSIIVNNTKYSGEVVEKLLVRATTTNELVDGGHVHVQPGIKLRLTLPRLRTGKMLQRRVAMPKSGAGGDSKGDFNYDEKYLEPQDVMAYTEFNPAIFEHIWRPFQPHGEMVFQELPTEIQEQLLSEMAKVIDMELGELYLTGVKGSGAREFFAGILTRIVLDPEVIKIATAFEIKEENILHVLRTIKKKIPKALRNSKKLKIFMSTEDFDIYDAVITDKPYKGADYTNMNPERYKGVPIVVLSDMPKDVIFVAEGTSGLDSNLWVGVNLVEDPNAIMVDKVANNGELYFFKMLMKADTNTVYGEDIVLWDGRGVAAPAGFAALVYEPLSFDATGGDVSETGLKRFIEAFVAANPGNVSVVDEIIRDVLSDIDPDHEYISREDVVKTAELLAEKEEALQTEKDKLDAYATELDERAKALIDATNTSLPTAEVPVKDDKPKGK